MVGSPAVAPAAATSRLQTLLWRASGKICGEKKAHRKYPECTPLHNSKILAFTVVRQCKENAVDCETMNNSHCVMNRKLDNLMITLPVRYSGCKETSSRSFSSSRKRYTVCQPVLKYYTHLRSGMGGVSSNDNYDIIVAHECINFFITF